jgi:hypothetical protein
MSYLLFRYQSLLASTESVYRGLSLRKTCPRALNHWFGEHLGVGEGPGLTNKRVWLTIRNSVGFIGESPTTVESNPIAQ